MRKLTFILRRLKTPSLRVGIKAALVFRPWESRALALAGSIYTLASGIILEIGYALIIIGSGFLFSLAVEYLK